MKKKRYFPCQICKGKGNFGDGDFVDVGIGTPMQVSAHNTCGNCDGQGMIEIGGDIHLRNKAISCGLKHLTENKDYSWDEIMEIGRKYL